MSDTQSAPAAFDKVLRGDLRKYIARLGEIENGGGLHEMVVSMVERSLLEVTLDETKGNQTVAAHILGLNRNTLRRKMKEYDIDPAAAEKPRKKSPHNGNGKAKR
ncbi:MAG: Fis family transcriptional regulator [Nitrospinae bacterium]|nr:Fis family transcriptional regulator [Nitrospinota bacterium]